MAVRVQVMSLPVLTIPVNMKSSMYIIQTVCAMTNMLTCVVSNLLYLQSTYQSCFARYYLNRFYNNLRSYQPRYAIALM